MRSFEVPGLKLDTLLLNDLGRKRYFNSGFPTFPRM